MWLTRLSNLHNFGGYKSNKNIYHEKNILLFGIALFFAATLQAQLGTYFTKVIIGNALKTVKLIK